MFSPQKIITIDKHPTINIKQRAQCQTGIFIYLHFKKYQEIFQKRIL